MSLSFCCVSISFYLSWASLGITNLSSKANIMNITILRWIRCRIVFDKYLLLKKEKKMTHSTIVQSPFQRIQTTKVEKLGKSTSDIERILSWAHIHLYKDFKMCSLIMKVGRSKSLKTHLFLSYHKFHITHRGMGCHTLSSLRWRNLLANTPSPKAQLHIWAPPKLAQIMQRQMTTYLLIKNNEVFPASFTHTTSNNYQHMAFARITNCQYLT